MGWFKLLKLKIQPKPNPTQALKKIKKLRPNPTH